jgi:S-formylglutathione hydrolase FrmB
MSRADERLGTDNAPHPATSTARSTTENRRWSRRRVLTLGLGGAVALAAAGVVGVELVSHGVLPGQQELDRLDGACSVDAPALRFSTLGATRNGSFFSQARHRHVGYTIAWPSGHGPGDALPLVVMLHGFGANHTNALTGMSPAQAVALHVGGRPLPPIAMVTVDGGGGYWHPHPGDDPMAMIVSELVPMCQQRNLGNGPKGIGTMGISMGGYGALILAEKYPDTFAAVAAIGPAVWTSYAQAQDANPGAYTSAADFAAYDAVTHASALKGTAVRVTSATNDPFHPGVVALATELPGNAIVDFSQGCHTGAFFTAQEPPSLEFLAAHLSAS